MCFYLPPVYSPKASKQGSQRPPQPPVSETRITSPKSINTKRTSQIPPYITISKSKVRSKPPINIETVYFLPTTAQPTPTWTSIPQLSASTDPEHEYLRAMDKDIRRSSILDQIEFIQNLNTKLNPKPVVVSNEEEEKKEGKKKEKENEVLKKQNERLDKLSSDLAGHLRGVEMKEAMGKSRAEGLQEGLRKGEESWKRDREEREKEWERKREERERERERERELEGDRMALLRLGGLGNGITGGGGNVFGSGGNRIIGFGFDGMMGGNGMGGIDGLGRDNMQQLHLHNHHHHALNPNTSGFNDQGSGFGYEGFGRIHGFGGNGNGNGNEVATGGIASPPVVGMVLGRLDEFGDQLHQARVDRERDRSDREERERRSGFRRQYPPYHNA